MRRGNTFACGTKGARGFPIKKILRAISPEDCTRVYLILWSRNGMASYRRTPRLRQVFWLRIILLATPSRKSSSGLCGFRPRTQRRDRSRISRDSLLSFPAPDRYSVVPIKSLAGVPGTCQAFPKGRPSKAPSICVSTQEGRIQWINETFVRERHPGGMFGLGT